MGNSQTGSNGAMSPPLPSPTPHTIHTVSALTIHTGESYGIPVPNVRSDRFEQELSSSLSGISGLSAHMASRTPFAGTDGIGDFISPGQYVTRLRANSVSVEPDISHSLPVVSQALPAVIKWDKGGTDVFISGSFNKWEKRLPLVKSWLVKSINTYLCNVRPVLEQKNQYETDNIPTTSNNFYTIVKLEEGEHQYKYFVDGHWVINPEEPTVTDCHGNLNNVIRVKKSDFEIIDALESDSIAVQSKGDNSDLPQSDYGQDTPPRRLTDKHIGPPVLPQHLLQVILNKDVSQHSEPGMLPEPNHVMLNHLYALSIKDGVMVLSDTSRFRKKCVTTLLYKPID